jgi:hypothetical protein
VAFARSLVQAGEPQSGEQLEANVHGAIFLEAQKS